MSMSVQDWIGPLAGALGGGGLVAILRVFRPAPREKAESEVLHAQAEASMAQALGEEYRTIIADLRGRVSALEERMTELDAAVAEQRSAKHAAINRATVLEVKLENCQRQMDAAREMGASLVEDGISMARAIADLPEGARVTPEAARAARRMLEHRWPSWTSAFAVDGDPPPSAT